jgi:hypothetical protein
MGGLYNLWETSSFAAAKSKFSPTLWHPNRAPEPTGVSKPERLPGRFRDIHKNQRVAGQPLAKDRTALVLPTHPVRYSAARDKQLKHEEARCRERKFRAPVVKAWKLSGTKT